MDKAVGAGFSQSERSYNSEEMVSRQSRPPGFDMTYRPEESVFAAPWLVRLPALAYFALALAVVAAVVLAERSSPGSWLHANLIVPDRHRVISSRTFALLLMVSSLAALIRASMRGVRVRGDGVECRELVNFGWPRVRKYRWAQVVCIILDEPGTIALDLWDGSREFLPRVQNRAGLAATLEKVGAARAIPVRGGTGLDDIPERVRDDDEN